MTIEGVDFSSARPKAADLVAAGKHFVVRYCPYQIHVDGVLKWVQKGLTATEISAYRAAGLAIVFNFESIAGRMKQGASTATSRANGIADAKLVEAAIARLKMPVATVCYFSADWDASSSEQPLVDAYLKGAASVMGAERIGVYAGYWVVGRCRANGTARWFWQTYAWSGGRIHDAAHLYQYRNGQIVAGSQVDLDRALKADYGQWVPPAKPAPAPAPEDLMPDLFSTPGRKTATVAPGTAHFDAPAGKQTGVITDAAARFDVIAQDKGVDPGWVLLDGASADEVKYPQGVLSRWVRASSLRNVEALQGDSRTAFNAGVDAAAKAAVAAKR
jgi:hypothetical protein